MKEFLRTLDQYADRQADLTALRSSIERQLAAMPGAAPDSRYPDLNETVGFRRLWGAVGRGSGISCRERSIIAVAAEADG